MTWLKDYIEVVEHYETSLTPINSPEAATELFHSVLSVPEAILPNPLRLFYKNRAFNGFDVHAYRKNPLGIWIVCDNDIRTPFNDKPATWVIESTLPLGMKDQCWSVYLSNISDKSRHFIGLRYENLNHVESMRRIFAYVQECNVTFELPESNYCLTTN